MKFEGKRVLVTGGTRGIGRACVRAFLEQGAQVAVNGRSAESVACAIETFEQREKLAAAPGDVATVADCKAVVSAALKAFGELDILVNSAGVYHEALVADSDELLWDQTMDINLKGTFFCIQAALDSLRRTSGVIVNIASDAGLHGIDRSAVYCASKAGVVLMTRAMAIEFAPDVRVNCVCPGFVETDMVRTAGEASGDYEQYMVDADAYAPLRRIGQPQEIADAVLYLASPQAGFVTGAALSIDGGVTA